MLLPIWAHFYDAAKDYYIITRHKSLLGILLCTYQKHEQRSLWIQRTLLTNTSDCFRCCKMKLINLVILAFLTVQLATFVSGMGLCFGGYPQCCANGKNTCGPFCASCSRVGEFLRNMNMFAMMGMGMGTPAVFRIINPDPNAIGAARPVPFPAKPLPTNFNDPWNH